LSLSCAIALAELSFATLQQIISVCRQFLAVGKEEHSGF